LNFEYSPRLRICQYGDNHRFTADAVDAPGLERREIRVMNELDIATLLDAARETPYFALFHTALFTAMRRSELLALCWCDIDLLLCQASVNRSLHVLEGGKVVFRSPKTAKARRTIALSPSAVSVLREQRKERTQECALLGVPLTDDDLVFSQLDGRPLLPDTITHVWIRLVKRIGLEGIRFHDLRHTHASLMLKAGVHPKVVQERLGHASIEITLDTYSHLVPGLQEAAAQRFDDMLNQKTKSEVVESHY